MIFDKNFRDKRFVDILSDTIASNSDLANVTGMGKIYQMLSNKSAWWNKKFIEPIRDILYRTPSNKICEIDKYSLFHYNNDNTLLATSSTFNTTNIKDNFITQSQQKDEKKAKISYTCNLCFHK